MDEEAKRAAAILREMIADDSRWCDKSISERSDINNRWNIQAVKVVHSYLAEHPADEDEPVTEEWLKTLATEFEMDKDGDRVYRFRVSEDACEECWLVFSVDKVGWHETVPHLRYYGRKEGVGVHDVYWPVLPKTRGQFRVQCRALGIPLKESA